MSDKARNQPIPNVSRRVNITIYRHGEGHADKRTPHAPERLDMAKVFGEEVEAQPEQGRNTLKFLRSASIAPRFPLQLANKIPGIGGNKNTWYRRLHQQKSHSRARQPIRAGTQYGLSTVMLKFLLHPLNDKTHVSMCFLSIWLFRYWTK